MTSPAYPDPEVNDPGCEDRKVVVGETCAEVAVRTAGTGLHAAGGEIISGQMDMYYSIDINGYVLFYRLLSMIISM